VLLNALLGGVLIVFLLIIAGCASTDDSELPWNNPQPWEGSPMVPGMNTQQ